LTANATKVVEIITEHGPMCKESAELYGMKKTTFRRHARKLVEMGILEMTEEKVIGKGRPRVLYCIKED